MLSLAGETGFLEFSLAFGGKLPQKHIIIRNKIRTDVCVCVLFGYVCCERGRTRMTISRTGLQPTV